MDIELINFKNKQKMSKSNNKQKIEALKNWQTTISLIKPKVQVTQEVAPGYEFLISKSK